MSEHILEIQFLASDLPASHSWLPILVQHLLLPAGKGIFSHRPNPKFSTP